MLCNPVARPLSAQSLDTFLCPLTTPASHPSNKNLPLTSSGWGVGEGRHPCVRGYTDARPSLKRELKSQSGHTENMAYLVTMMEHDHGAKGGRTKIWGDYRAAGIRKT